MLEKCEDLHKSRWKNVIKMIQKKGIAIMAIPFAVILVIVLFYNYFACCAVTHFYDIYALCRLRKFAAMNIIANHLYSIIVGFDIFNPCDFLNVCEFTPFTSR